MALLRRWMPWMGVALVSCHGASGGGTIEVDRFEAAVRCDEAGCVTDGPLGGAPIERPVGSPTEGFAFLSLEIRDDLLLYAEIPFEGGMGHLEIEIRGEEEPIVSYVERVGGEVTFVGERVAGVVEVPIDALNESCPCETGRLELRFLDAGEDGLWNTGDDQVRQLGGGRFERGDTFCVSASSFPIDEDLDVRRIDRCPSPPSSSPPPTSSPSPSYPSSPSSGSASCDTSGCSGDGVTCDGGSGSSGGCGSSGSSGGCEGDDSASCAGDDSASCDGGGGDATCTGDAAALPACRIPRGCRGGLGDGRLQLVLLLALILIDLRRRARPVAASIRSM